MTALVSALKNSAVDLAGLGFVGAAIFLLVTGHVNEPGFGVAVSIGSAYLGLKVPTSSQP